VSLWLARSQAINSMQYTLVCSSADAQQCDGSGHWENGWIVFIDSNRNRQRDPGEAVLDRGEPFNSQLTARSSRSRSKIRYNIMGYSPGTNVTITFCDQRGPAHAAALIVSNTGRPRQVRGSMGEARCL
jgi:type IV fimbrial biogenesis protein FimT